MVKKANPFSLGLSATFLVLAILACDRPIGVATQAGNLSATETMRALATRVAGTLEPRADNGEKTTSSGDLAEADSTDESALFTPTVTLTPTLGAPVVYVSVDTNCRFGPGDVYEYLGALLVGEEAAIVGKLADESFWYIENPDPPPPYCWIWGAYAQVEGDTSNVPILTPPPTPTPEATPTPTPNVVIDAYLKQVVQNGSEWTIMIRIANHGDVDLESFKLIVVDTDTSKTRTKASDTFGIGPSMAPGQDDYPTVKFNYNVTTHNMEATVKMCTEDGLSGICAQMTFPFVP